MWVFLALASINSRKAALWLVGSCAAFTLYCVPWPTLFPDHQWLHKVFLIDDWTWFASMVPLTAWYWLSLRWADNHSAWNNDDT
ncbi:MAG: hypothetical protein KDJ39_17735 [Gammaproteobacteria bacterium]|nr:hypothetical protein [Gammaproteobacteria bacterium]MCP5299844.1 hypothetical protein [Chromatiaceae bacterium]